MGKKIHYQIPIYTIGTFGSHENSFWMGNIADTTDIISLYTKPHQQTYYLLLYVESGTCKIESDGYSVVLKEKETLCLTPNTINTFHLNLVKNGYFILFDESFFSLRYNSNILQRFSFYNNKHPQSTVLAQKDIGEWQSLLSFMYNEFSLDPPEWKVLRSYLNILLHLLEKNKKTEIGYPLDKDISHDKVRKFTDLLEQHFIQHKNPSYYAEKLNVTQAYLNKLCKREKGITTRDIIKERTILESKRLLKHTPDTIAEIAYVLGFESPSYFITFFKKDTGWTPEKFRKNAN